MDVYHLTQNFWIDLQHLTGTAERAKSPETSMKHVKGTQISIQNIQPGKQNYLFRISVHPGNFPVEQTKRLCSIILQLYIPTGNSRNFW